MCHPAKNTTHVHATAYDLALEACSDCIELVKLLCLAMAPCCTQGRWRHGVQSVVSFFLCRQEAALAGDSCGVCCGVLGPGTLKNS